MTDPLRDPVLEAAAQIIAKWFLDTTTITDGRYAVESNPAGSRALIEEAGRQIDNLRKTGALKEAQIERLSPKVATPEPKDMAP